MLPWKLVKSIYFVLKLEKENLDLQEFYFMTCMRQYFLIM